MAYDACIDGKDKEEIIRLSLNFNITPTTFIDCYFRF